MIDVFPDYLSPSIRLDKQQEQEQDFIQSSLHHKLDCEDNMYDSLSRPLEQNPDVIANRLMQKAHNRDGLPEIAIGVFFLAVAGLNWLHATFHGRSPFGMASVWLLMLSPAIMFGSKWAIKQARGRFLIEKVGYVKLKPLNRSLMARVMGIAVVTAVVMAFATYFLARAPGAHLHAPDAHLHSVDWDLLTSWSFAGTGVFGGILWVMCGRLPRFVIGGTIMAATGIALAFTGVGPERGMSIFYGTAGLLSLVSGCVVLFLFLRQPTEPRE